MSNVRKEIELYEPMVAWLKEYLEDLYKRQKCEIRVVDAHAWTLDKILEQHGVISQYPQVVGLDIEIDVLGIVIFPMHSELFFVEAKKTALTLRDLGQLWAYCRLCNPKDAFLLSSKSLGSLDKLLNNLNREDLLDFGNGKTIKKMKVAVWDVGRATVNQHSLVPKL